MNPNEATSITEGLERSKRIRRKPSALEQAVEFDGLPDSAHVPPSTVQAVYRISQATYWRWLRDGRLPKLYKLGPGAQRHNVGEIRQYLASAKGA